jgi:hypothetical protein
MEISAKQKRDEEEYAREGSQGNRVRHVCER